jgi:hypothetical protein
MNYPEFDIWAETVLFKDVTYMFELCTPENQQVVKHSSYSVTLLGARHLSSLEEIPLHRFNNWYDLQYIKLCPTAPILDVDTCVKWVNSQPASENEGLVVCDKTFNRVKIKSEAYKVAHKLKDKTSNSPRAILEMILLQKDDDIRDLLSDKNKEVLSNLKDGIRNLIFILEKEFEENFSTSRKEFALSIQRGSGLLGPQMWRWENKKENYVPSVTDWFSFLGKNNSIPHSILDSILKTIKDKNIRN